MELNLKNKIVILTGGAGIKGSIGETILRSLASEGAIPALIDRNDRGIDYIGSIRERGIDGLFVKTDLTQPDEIEKAVTSVIHKYGRIDAVINNVGVNDGVGLDGSYQDFVSSLHLNLISYFLTVKHALPGLKESRGNILNIGSKVAYTGQGSTSGYAASKGGVLALTREWAVDLAPSGIRCNCLIIAESWTPAYDNWIKTLENGKEKLERIKRTIPFENRMTTPREIADLALFTISEKSSHTTGQHIFVDGGYVHLDRAMLSE